MPSGLYCALIAELQCPERSLAIPDRLETKAVNEAVSKVIFALDT